MTVHHTVKRSHYLEKLVKVTVACKKGKVFPYSLLSIGPGADPGVQAVSPQVTWSESGSVFWEWHGQTDFYVKLVENRFL